MVQITEGTINLNHLQLENQEVEKVLACWKPEVLIQVSLKQDMSVHYLQSVNVQTEYVMVRGENKKVDVISFKELKENYIPVLTGEKMQEVVESLPTDFLYLKEKLSYSIWEEPVYKQ